MSRPDEFHDWPTLLNDLLAGRDLSAAFAGQAMTAILSGDATEAQIAGFLVALRAKGVTSEELSGLLAAALEAATFVPLTDFERENTVDVVGTGGDGSNSINVSTMAAIVAAGAGAADSPRELAERCDVVITCLPNPAASSTVVEGPDGLLDGILGTPAPAPGVADGGPSTPCPLLLILAAAQLYHYGLAVDHGGGPFGLLLSAGYVHGGDDEFLE